MSWSKLSGDILPQRREKYQRVSKERSGKLQLVLQDVHNEHNISACLRSAEAFGIQNVNIVHLKENFKATSVSRGVSKWLTTENYPSAKELKKAKPDYKIAVAYPSTRAFKIADLPIDKPLCVVFANEHDGADQSWGEVADYEFTIPMVGMVESLNISVSCAITLYTLRERMLCDPSFLLNTEEQNKLLDQWAVQHFPKRKTSENQ